MRRSNVTVDGGGVGPIGLDSDKFEVVTLDQPTRDSRAGAVELRGSVRRFPQ
jgi:hypothetical protein